MSSRFQFKRLKKWQQGGDDQNMELAIPLPKSLSGLVLRWCPNTQCQPRRFQLGDRAGDEPPQIDRRAVRRLPGSPGCTCPYCGTDENDESFVAPEDIDAAKADVTWAAGEDLGDWAEQMAKDFNREVGGGNNILGISMSVSRSRRPRPRPWRQDLLRAMECHRCSRLYGVYAIGFFCPDCGTANLANHFRREFALVVAQLDIAEGIESEGDKELAYRLLGNAHEDVVTAFETYLKSGFGFVSRKRLSADALASLKAELKGNPFQNLDRTGRLFQHLEIDPFKGLTVEDRRTLTLNFEKRHIIGHNLGMADERYAEVVENAPIGETVSLLADEIERFAGLCVRVVSEVESGCPEFHPPGVSEGAA